MIPAISGLSSKANAVPAMKLWPLERENDPTHKDSAIHNKINMRSYPLAFACARSRRLAVRENISFPSSSAFAYARMTRPI